MDELKVTTTQQFMGKEIPVVLGGFGEDKKCISDKTIAEIHNQPVVEIRKSIGRNINRFKVNVDFIDFKIVSDEITNNLLFELGYSQMQISKAEHIYILSERGYSKLIKIMDTDLAWEIHDKLMDEYFQMREEKKLSIDEIINNPDFGIQLLSTLKKEKEKRKVLEVEVKIKEQIIGELKPKADYTSMILNNKGLVTITQIAKDYGMSGQEMNKILHNLGVQYKQSEQWLLYKTYQDKGYTHSTTVDIKHKDGTPDIRMNTKWTQKGRLFLYELLKKNGYLPVIEQQQTA